MRLKLGEGVVPGVALALVLALAGQFLARTLGESLIGPGLSPLSPVMMAILLGLLVRNTIGLPAWAGTGVRFSLVRVMRLGIVLLGLRLGLVQAGEIGVQALPVILGCVVGALLLVTLFGRLLGVSARLGTLVAVGTAICGSTAIVALSPSIHAREDETAYAVACVTVFGLVAMLVYPFLAQLLFEGDALRVGVFLGTAVHDTAQVVGAGLVYEQRFGVLGAMDGATVTKLVRNLCMLIVVPLLAVLYQRQAPETAGGGQPWHRLVPLFVLGFAAMSLLRTVGDLGDAAFGILPRAAWESFLEAGGTLSTLCLGVAMAAVGLGTSLRGLRDIGLRPLLVGLASAALVGVMSWSLVLLFVP